MRVIANNSRIKTAHKVECGIQFYGLFFYRYPVFVTCPGNRSRTGGCWLGFLIVSIAMFGDKSLQA